jgi:hypothetical protein
VGPATVHHASRYPLRTSFAIAWHICERRNAVGVAEWKTRMVESLPKQLRGSLPNIEDLEAGLAGDRSTTPTTQF